MRVTDEQLETCRRQGFAIIPDFLREQERKAALDGFFRLFAPPYARWIALEKKNDTPALYVFPWDDSGLNYAATHPDLIDAAERLMGTREIWLSNAGLGMRYAGEEPVGTGWHIDWDNNTASPMLPQEAWKHPVFFYCLEEVRAGMAPIRMVPNGHDEKDAVEMIVPAGSLCIYSLYTMHAASPFTAAAGDRPTMWVTMTRKDRLWDGMRSPMALPHLPAMKRFVSEATPRQRELVGFPPPGDAVWTDDFLQAMGERYPGFDPRPYRDASGKSGRPRARGSVMPAAGHS